MAPGSFAALPAHERQAFFVLLDEYFESRPHLLPGSGGGGGDLQPTPTYAPVSSASSSAAPPAPVARSQAAPPPAARRTGGPAPPAGLSAGKAIGRINMQSTGAAFGSMIMGKPRPEEPATPGQAIAGVAPANSRGAPPPAPLPRTTAPAPPVVEEAPAPYGQAEALYDYVGAEAEDLSVKRFEVVDLVEKISEDWWKARAIDGSGRIGIVPSSYVKQI